MLDTTTTEALAAARTNAASRTTYPADTGPADPDQAAREAIAEIAPFAPSAGVAAALLNAAAVQPVPLNRDSLEPTGEPLQTLAAVHDHWRANHADGVGIRAGAHANGSATFAVHGTLATLRGWLADIGTQLDERRNEYGSVVSTSRSYRPVSRFVQIGWSAAPARPQTVTAFGAELVGLQHGLRNNRGDIERALAGQAWLAWTVALDEAHRRLVVRSRRLADGLRVLGEGETIPWHVRAANGAVLSGTNLPLADAGEPLSPWLADAVGVQWKTVR